MKFARYPATMRGLLGAPGAVATIGAYDGLHIGHQALLAATRRAASRHGLPAVVMSFEPTPKEYFGGPDAPARITRFRERFEWLRDAGLDAFFCPRFGTAMAGIDVDAFIEQWLVAALGLKHLVVGDDFRFGYQAAGTVEDLSRAGRRHGFAVEEIGSIEVAGERVSSTAIRAALAAGDMDSVRHLLGRAYVLGGKVIHGQQLGRTLGFPTANIDLHRRVAPVRGIYAVRVKGIDTAARDGVASIGTRPTVNGQGVLLEVFVFDFQGDLYGKRLEVELVARLRDEEKFDSLEALTEQMARDADNARKLLTSARD